MTSSDWNSGNCSIEFSQQTTAQVFSCEFCEIFKNPLFTKHLRQHDSFWIFSFTWLFLPPSKLIETSFFYFWSCFITSFERHEYHEVCIWKTLPCKTNNPVVAAWQPPDGNTHFSKTSRVVLHLKVTKAACSIEKAILKKFISQENIWVFNKVAGLQACSFIKRTPQHRCFSINIAKFLRIFILNNICERLPLKSEWIKNSSFCECSVKKQVFYKKDVLRYLIKLTGKHL